MSTWGYFNFDNDVAADFAGSFRDNPDDSALRQALELVAAEDGSTLADDTSEALAAAEIVAAILGKPSRDFPADLLLVIGKIDGRRGEYMRELAQQAVSSILLNSELQAFWTGTDDAKNWQHLQKELLERLK
ncbi:hypothetical protein GCM10027346_02030 [Hymenobacter seoulensis]